MTDSGDCGGGTDPTLVLEILRGFMAFKSLASAHELGLFARLSGGQGITAEDLARELEIALRPAEMLLTACAALGLLHMQDGRYCNSLVAEEFLVAGQPYYLGGAVELYDKRLYAGWGQLSRAIRTNRPTTWDAEARRSLFECDDPDERAVFWEGMHALSSYAAHAMAQALDFSLFRCLLDVGGGSGASVIELCRRYPRLRATIYDLPPVTPISARKVAEAGLADRITVRAGDFFVDPLLPEGHDVLLLSLVLHDWAPERNAVILEKCYRALPSGGCLVISEHLVHDDRTGPLPAALKSLCMLVETEGRNYTPSEYATWLRAAGFCDVRTIWAEVPGATDLLTARKP